MEWRWCVGPYLGLLLLQFAFEPVSQGVIAFWLVEADEGIAFDGGVVFGLGEGQEWCIWRKGRDRVEDREGREMLRSTDGEWVSEWVAEPA
jgi:hypothetical protein